MKNVDKPILFNPRSSVFIGGQPCFGFFQRALPILLFLFLAITAAAADLPRFRWRNFTVENGLPDKRSHDLWIGTMGGLSRYSAGRFDTFTQLNSGLPNDVVYGVSVQGDFVWVATAAGGARLNTRSHQWSLFNERNTPMYEIWTYNVAAAPDKVYYAVWGGGVLEYDVKTERWKDYNDPDGETEMVLHKDEGLIHEITTSVSYVNQILWVATYFGVSRYDGRG